MTRVRFGVAMLALGLTAAVAIEAGRELAVRSAVRKIFAGHPDWTFAKLTVAPFGDSVSLQNIHARAGGLRVAIGALRMSRPSAARLATDTVAALFAPTADAAPTPPPRPATLTPQAPPPPPVPGNATAENIVVTGNAMTYRIKRIDLTSSLLTSGDLNALFDSKSPESISDRLKKVSASSISIPEIVGDSTVQSGEQHWILKQLAFTTVIAGKAAAASVGPITFASKTGDAESNGSINTLRLTNVDLAQSAHVLTSVRTNDNEPILPLFDTATATAIQATDPTRNATITVESATERGVRARAPKTDIQSSSGALAQGATAPAKKNALIDDLLHSFEVDSMELVNVSAPVSDQAGLGKLGVAKVFMKGLAQGRLGSSGFDGLAYAGPNGKVTIGGFSLGGFQMPLPKESDPRAPSAMPVVDKLTVDAVDCHLSVVSKNGAEASTTAIQFKLARMSFSGENLSLGTIPRQTNARLDHLSFDVTPQTDTVRLLSAMGYTHVDLSSALSADYDDAKQSLAIKPFALSGVGMGVSSLALDLGNAGKGLISSDPETARASASALVANRIDLKLHNDGLVQKILDLKAKMDGLTTAEESQYEIDFFSKQIPDMANGHPAAKRFGEAVAKFIADPKTLHVTITSKRGLGMADAGLILSPDVLLDTLDLQASAND